jgi:iron-sulfur cluster assembly protein
MVAADQSLSSQAIQLSPAAVAEIKRLRSKQANPSLHFRLAIQPGGCSGLIYQLGFEADIGATDHVAECNGLSIVIDPHSLSQIAGLRVDYSEDLMGGGFRFHNPHALSHCSCGNSFILSA